MDLILMAMSKWMAIFIGTLIATSTRSTRSCAFIARSIFTKFQQKACVNGLLGTNFTSLITLKIQRSAKVMVGGLVKFVPALA